MKKLLVLLLILLFPLSSFAATKFLEPGGDATFNVALTTAGGFYQFLNNTPTVATDFVHGAHIKSLRFNGTDIALGPDASLSDSGSRVSFYLYVAALPTGGDVGFMELDTSGGGAEVIYLKLTTGGVLKVTDKLSAQLGSTGTTLSVGKWYRISLAYTITSTSVNRFEIFVNGVSDISLTNVTLTNTSTSAIAFGQALTADAASDFRISDMYVDSGSNLKDPGNIWVTAKRPNANGTANNFSTQVGSGGSGYGTGHSPQVNERPLSTTNGWSVVGAGSAVTEEYNVENTAAGDIDISNPNISIIDVAGWVNASSLVGETTNIILNGSSLSQAITSTNTTYTKFAGSPIYPLGAGADIGIQTDTSLTTVTLNELGVMVAYIPYVPPRFLLNFGTFVIRNGIFLVP